MFFKCARQFPKLRIYRNDSTDEVEDRTQAPITAKGLIMKNQTLYAPDAMGILPDRLSRSVKDSIMDEKKHLRRVLLVVPDISRYYSNAGLIANLYYHELKDHCEVRLLIALGTHAPMTVEQCLDMYGDIPFELFISHHWRTDLVKLGELPAQHIDALSEGTMAQAISVEVNKHLLDGYDLILSIGQVLPHEVVGMANHAKNILVGCGGSEMINDTHMLGAIYGMERMMGRDHSPVRQVLDYAAEHFLSGLPITYVLTVTTEKNGKILTHGLFIGSEREQFEKAVALSQKVNITIVERALKKVVVYLDPKEFRSTWLGNKAIYRTRMAIADGGALVILAPGVARFGEDKAIDSLIRKYGYRGREKVIGFCHAQNDLKANLSAAAHLIHGSSEGRFTITYCTPHLDKSTIESVNYAYAPYDETVKRYDPEKLVDGFNTMSDGEEIFYISNPALGLWAERSIEGC